MEFRVNFLVVGFYNITNGDKIQNIKRVTYDVHTTKHNSMCQNKQGLDFQILITYLNANDPNATNKNSCSISFGAYSSCFTICLSFAISRATNQRHGWFSTFHSDIQQL
jgi:hypothetical protein